MNLKNELNKIQVPLPGMINPEEEYFERATQEDIEKGMKCFVCGNPLELDAPYILKILYDSPFDKEGTEVAIHVENDLGERLGPCDELLEDHSFADFRFFECCSCLREICEQNPACGHQVQYRTTEDGSLICLQCYMAEIMEFGIPREKFEEEQISGMFLIDREMKEAGFEKVDQFSNFMINSKMRAEAYCKHALKRIDAGYRIVTSYERLSIMGDEGEVTMWIKKNEEVNPDGKEG